MVKDGRRKHAERFATTLDAFTPGGNGRKIFWNV